MMKETYSIEEKYEHLKRIIADMGSVAVAYSSGVDSTFLLSVAKEVLGEAAIAVTIQSHSFPGREYEEAVAFCDNIKVRQFVCQIDELEIEGFAENPVNRCYICKKVLFQNLLDVAQREGVAYVIEGSNLDDDQDYRPGRQAIRELGIRSPLREAMLTKAEIRELSRRRELPTWNKPSFACLSSRFAYGERITKEKLQMVEQAENLLMDHGFSQVRVRMHGMMARIEFLPEDVERFFVMGIREEVYETLKELGFSYVAVDMAGYRSGSMNESIQS